ncbi:MAG: hypothetical protein J0L91_10025 [Burkholderiales bacterium]|nr:hypothetical protein [Burkholderiales bacterium]
MPAQDAARRARGLDAGQPVRGRVWIEVSRSANARSISEEITRPSARAAATNGRLGLAP